MEEYNLVSDIDLSLELLNEKRNKDLQKFLKYINSLNSIIKADFSIESTYDIDNQPIISIYLDFIKTSDNIDEFIKKQDEVFKELFIFTDKNVDKYNRKILYESYWRFKSKDEIK